MSLPITTEMLARAYHYLEATQPFRKWNMPDADDVVFRAIKDPAVRGWFQIDRIGRYTIALSSRCIGHTENLMRTMAHEMIHLHQADVKMETGAEHNAAFYRLAAQVCKAHGWDVKDF
jgi:hypothetical protein